MNNSVTGIEVRMKLKTDPHFIEDNLKEELGKM